MPIRQTEPNPAFMTESRARTRMENPLVSPHRGTGRSPARHYQPVHDGSFPSGLNWAALKSASSVWTSHAAHRYFRRVTQGLLCSVMWDMRLTGWELGPLALLKKCKPVTRASEAFEFIDICPCSHAAEQSQPYSSFPSSFMVAHDYLSLVIYG